MRQKPADVASDVRVSFAFKCIVDDIPALLHLAAGCDKLRPSRLRLIAVATNIRIKPLLDIGGRIPLVRAKCTVCFWNS